MIERSHEEMRVLLVAPTGRDAELAEKIAESADIACEICTNLQDFCQMAEKGVGALVVAEEVLYIEDPQLLLDCLAVQEPWSDLPVLVLTHGGAESPTANRALEVFGNAFLLDRPVRLATFISALRSALRARRRQYQLRDYLHERKKTEQQHQFLAEASAILSGSIDYSTTLGQVARLLVPRFADWCSIELDRDKQGLQQVAVAHSQAEMVELAVELRRRYPPRPDLKGGVHDVMASGTSVVYETVSDGDLRRAAQDDEHYRIMRDLSLRSAAVVPLIAHDRVLGAMTLVYAESDRRFSQDDLGLLEELATRCAMAITNADLYFAAQKEIEERRQAEKALKESEKRLAVAISAAPVVVYTADAELRYRWMLNPTHGFKVEDIVGKRDDELLPPESVKELIEFKESVLRSGTPGRREIPVRNDSGLFWYDISAEPVKDESGKITGLTVAALDITARRQTEQQIMESEQRLRVMLDNIPVGIWFCDKDGQIIFGNPAATDIWGGARYVGREEYQEYKGWWLDTNERICAREWALARALERGETSLNEEIEIEAFDGQRKIIRNSAVPIFDDSGATIGAVVLNEDITEAKQAEVALARENERVNIEQRRLKTVLDLLPLAVFIADKSGKIIQTNAAADALWGTAKGTEAPDNYGEDYHAWWPSTGRRVQSQEWGMWRSLSKGERCIAEEMLIETSLGDRRTILNYSVPIHDDSGEIAGGVALNVDITERKQWEESLRLSEERFRRLIESSTVGLAIGDITGRLSYANPVYLAMIEYAEEELHLGVLNWDAMTVPDHRERDQQAVRQCLENGICEPYEKLVLSKSGQHIPVLVGAALLKQPTDGKGELAAFITDLRPLKAAQAALEESETRLRLAAEVTGLGTWDHDLEADRLKWSDQCKRILGLPLDTEPSVQLLESLVHPDDLGKLMEQIRMSVANENGGRYEIEMRILWPDRSIRWVVARGQVFFDNSTGTPRAQRFLGTVLDITGRKEEADEKLRLEAQFRQAQKLESLGIMAGGVAHDFNNLLVAIMANTDLVLEEQALARKARESLQDVQVAAKHAANLCQQMLAYSGKGRFVIEPIDLNYLVRDLEHLLSASTSRRARLVFSLENTLPAVEADATQMRQIILNLVTNAAEAISSCDGEIVVTTGTTAVNEESTPPFIMDGELKPGAYVFLNVTDNGTGISEKTMQRIFDPFFTTKFTGRGLGLAAVLGIVRGHRGAIAVQTERGRGTSFTIYLPALPHRIDMVPTPLPIRQQAKSAGKILLVDDVSTVLAVGKRILEKEGFEVLIARHGREALDLFASEGHNIACVILDLTMPEMDGVETAVELWKKNPKLPIVLSSGYSEQESLDRFPAGMVAGFIPKPYQPHLLLDRVRQAIGPRQ